MSLHYNPSFELPWTDLPPVGALTNQQPAGFKLLVRGIGMPLQSLGYAPDDPPIFETVAVIPECVHKLRRQLPASETGPGGLILDGDVTYKIFAASGAFSVDLTCLCVIPDDGTAGTAEIAVPVQVHSHGDASPGAAVWRLVVNGEPTPWRSFGDGFQDRVWCTQHHTVSVNPNDLLTVTLQAESRAEGGIDFFTDAWNLELTPDTLPEPEPEPTAWFDARAVVVDFDLITNPETRLAYYTAACNRGIVVGPSHDHAATWPPGARSYTVELPGIPLERRSAFTAYYANIDPRITLHYTDSPAPPPSPAPLPPISPAPQPPVRCLIGLHSQRAKTGWLDFYARVKPGIFKGFDLGMCWEVKQVSPETLVVYRHHVDNDGYWINRRDLKASAREFHDLYALDFKNAAANLGITVSELLESVDVIESVNEVIGTRDPELEPAVEFDCYFAEGTRVRYGHQISAGILTIAVGNPGETEVAKLLPAAEQSATYGHYLAYHAYWPGNRTRHWLSEHWSQLAGRWTEWDKVFSAHRVFPRYYSGETALCYSEDGWSLNPNLGWKGCGPFLDYIDQIVAFESLCQTWNASHGHRFRGATLFCYGGYGWEGFDWEPGDLDELAEALR